MLRLVGSLVTPETLRSTTPQTQKEGQIQTEDMVNRVCRTLQRASGRGGGLPLEVGSGHVQIAQEWTLGRSTRARVVRKKREWSFSVTLNARALVPKLQVQRAGERLKTKTNQPSDCQPRLCGR